jgi:D-tyrosyl-tRNA(Tyr) deacylase
VRALLQRVARAGVRVGGRSIAEIGPGLLILMGVGRAEHSGAEERLAERCAGLRIFEDDRGKMNRSVLDTGGQALVVPQFTLYADTAAGRRPGFDPAAPPDQAERAFGKFCDALAARGVPTLRGAFGERMEVELVNVGPATFLLEVPAG